MFFPSSNSHRLISRRCIVLLLQVVPAHVQMSQESVIPVEVWRFEMQVMLLRADISISWEVRNFCFAGYVEPGVSEDLQKH